jgi:hypothetical protein
VNVPFPFPNENDGENDLLYVYVNVGVHHGLYCLHVYESGGRAYVCAYFLFQNDGAHAYALLLNQSF